MYTGRLLGEGIVEDRFCGYCGRELRPGDSFCPNCGKPTTRDAQGLMREASVQPPPTQQPQQEAIQELARGIVREAGLQPDTEREAQIEGSKLEAEAFKTQVLIFSGLLVGLSAVVGILPKANMLWLLFLAFSFVLTSVVFGVLQMRHIARELADPQRAQQNWLLLFQSVQAPLSYLVAGLLVFSLIPLVQPSWRNARTLMELGCTCRNDCVGSIAAAGNGSDREAGAKVVDRPLAVEP
jgi:hypothetical protein